MKNVIFALGCTGTYSASTSLPSTVSTLSTDVTPIKACMTNPSDSGNKKAYLIYLNQTKDIKDKPLIQGAQAHTLQQQHCQRLCRLYLQM